MKIYIQEDLTTTSYEIPGITWELSNELLEKFYTHKWLSKLVFNEDKSSIIDIVEDEYRKIRHEEQLKNEQIKEQARLKRVQFNRKMNHIIPSPTVSAASLLRTMLPKIEVPEAQKLEISGLYDNWQPGQHTVGEVFNTRDGIHASGYEWNQTWEVHQDYDNSVYPDVCPGNPAWFTFNRPLHGKTAATARMFIKPQNGTTDIYRAGEYMIYTDGCLYLCTQDTDFSPEEYAGAWQKQE